MQLNHGAMTGRVLDGIEGRSYKPVHEVQLLGVRLENKMNQRSHILSVFYRSGEAAAARTLGILNGKLRYDAVANKEQLLVLLEEEKERLDNLKSMRRLKLVDTNEVLVPLKEVQDYFYKYLVANANKESPSRDYYDKLIQDLGDCDEIQGDKG